MRLHTPRVTGSFEVSSSVLTVNSSGTISGSATSTGSFGAIRAAGMTVPNLLDFSSSIASRVTSEESDFTAAGISGSWQNVIGSGSLGMVSGSAISTGSFGTVQIGGKQVYGDASGIGIGISDPADILHLSDGTSETRVQIENTGTGDPILMLQTDGLKNWYMGIDRSDSHKLHWHNTGGAWDPDNAQMDLSLEGDLTLSGSFESQFGNISGSSSSTGSFGRVEATKLSGDGSSVTNVIGTDPNAVVFGIVFGG